MDESKAHGKRKLMPVLTRLKELRDAHGESRMKLVRELELTYQVIQKWEIEYLHQLDTNILYLLMDRYNVTFEELIYKATDEDIQRIDSEKIERAEKRSKKDEDEES